MPKRKNPDTSTRTVTLPNELWQFIDQTDWDSLRDRPRYGHLTRYFESLVRQDMARHKRIKELANG